MFTLPFQKIKRGRAAVRLVDGSFYHEWEKHELLALRYTFLHSPVHKKKDKKCKGVWME